MLRSMDNEVRRCCSWCSIAASPSEYFQYLRLMKKLHVPEGNRVADDGEDEEDLR